MSYVKRDNVPARSGEQVVEMDGGVLVAISCANTRSGSDLVLHARARALHEGGNPATDAAGLAFESEHPHTASADAITLHSLETLARDCMMLTLGEATEVLNPSQAVRDSASIRAALRAASLEGAIDAGSML